MKQKWLDSAVFYEVYPTSFFDSSGDGVGDINGIIQKLDYIADLGCNGIWLNPHYESPFMDGGYDVSDYCRTNPLFGTNDDMKRLFEEAAKRDIKIILDLVMGHTSDRHPWFIESCKEDVNEYTDAYIWSDNMDVEHCEGRFMCGLSQRPHMYKVNYYAMQPALNYGYYRRTKSWQTPMDSPAAIKNMNRLIDVCSFWLDMGAAGFRVDMAHAMVKGDISGKGTIKFWRRVFGIIKKKYPDSVFPSEWNRPGLSVSRAGFDMDFYLPFGYTKTWAAGRDNEQLYAGTYISSACKKYNRFMPGLIRQAKRSNKSDGYHIIHLGNHDTIRMSRGRSDDLIKVLWASYLTLPGVPLIYYGDEIGMRYQPLKSKDGGYQRTGARTPMQWNNEKNLGFSSTDAELYLPVEPRDSPYTVGAQLPDDNSILNHTKRLIGLKRSLKCLNASSEFKVLFSGTRHDGSPLVYRRRSDKDEAVIVIHPRSCDDKLNMRRFLKGKSFDSIVLNASASSNMLSCRGASYAVFYRSFK